MNVLLSLSNIIFPFITFPYVSRILGPAGIGKVNFATSLISYFNIFAQLGVPTYGIRAVARVREDKEALTRTCQELLCINLVTSVLSYIALAIALLTVPRLFDERTLYMIVSMSMLLSAIGMDWMYQGLEQYGYITMRSIISKLIAYSAMFVLVKSSGDYVIYGAISVFASSAAYLVNLFNARKYISFKPVGNYNFRQHLKPVFVFFAMSCATTVYTNMDNLMLGFISGDVEVGYYTAAVKVKSILVSLVTSLGAVVLPRASYYIEHGQKEDFYRISKKAIQFVFLVATPLFLYFVMHSQQCIDFLSGDAYQGAVIPMQIITPTILFIGVTNILGIQMLIPLGKEKYVLYSEIAGAIVDLILNAIFIPKIGASGAALGTLVAEFVVLLVQVYSFREDALPIFKQLRYWDILAGMAIAAIAVYFLGNILSVSAFMHLFITAVVYFGIYGIFMLVCKNEIMMQIVDTIVSKIKKN